MSLTLKCHSDQRDVASLNGLRLRVWFWVIFWDSKFGWNSTHISQVTETDQGEQQSPSFNLLDPNVAGWAHLRMEKLKLSYKRLEAIGMAGEIQDQCRRSSDGLTSWFRKIRKKLIDESTFSSEARRGMMKRSDHSILRFYSSTAEIALTQSDVFILKFTAWKSPYMRKVRTFEL